MRAAFEIYVLAALNGLLCKFQARQTEKEANFEALPASALEPHP